MKYIKFYDVNISKMDSKQLEEIFDRIKEEIEYHYNFNNKYPEFVHVYGNYISYMADKHPSSHLVMAIWFYLKPVKALFFCLYIEHMFYIK